MAAPVFERQSICTVLNDVQYRKRTLMPRRSDHTRPELAELIIEAATAIVAAEGAKGLTMRRIAEAVGYAAGSIYNAVGDLDLVLRRVHAGTLRELVGQLGTALDEASANLRPAERAVLIADTYMGFVAAHPHLWAALLERPPPTAAPVPEFYGAPRARLLEIVGGVIAPFFPETDARNRAVVALWAALQGLATLTLNSNLAFAAVDLDATEVARSIVLRYLTGHETAADTVESGLRQQLRETLQ